MATNLALDDDLIKEAVNVGHHPTKKAAVTAALKEYIERHKQQEILSLFNTIDYDKYYHYKKHRNRKLKE
ncbi:MAG TPA: type II toxin-antitoxin system VapB family antitoxin [Gammaproteobacteria bacterium]|jgi:Arc/MetJ family transcription regulator|nr:type II toxin-antitoxin system VapB family antitoxin [Gammaproteobacteria bacterium]